MLTGNNFEFQFFYQIKADCYSEWFCSPEILLSWLKGPKYSICLKGSKCSLCMQQISDFKCHSRGSTLFGGCKLLPYIQNIFYMIGCEVF